MKASNLLIHCELEAVPMRQMPAAWVEPAPDVMGTVASRPVEITLQSPSCISYSRPARRPAVIGGAK